LLKLFNKRVRGVYKAARDKFGVVSARMQDTLAGIRVVKSFAREREEARAFSDVNQAYLDENLGAIKLRTSFFPFVRFIASFGNTIMIGLGAYLILKGRFTVGGLVAYRSYGRYFFGPIDDLTQINDTVQRANAAGARLFEVLDAPETVTDKPGAVELPTPTRGAIELDDVMFRYKEGGPPVLNHVTLRIEPGQRAAFVGVSGAGKSTLFSLVARFYDVEHGAVRVDGYDVRDLTQVSLRRQVASVPQETFLFNGTVGENIRYARPEATAEEVERAARAANAHGFISTLPQGYDTLIGERGVKLSGGQRQRIAVARAFLAGGAILLLDEATSAVEAESERIIQDAIDRLMEGRTTLIAAHRLSTIRDADVIFVLDGHGRIAESGRHDDLMAAPDGIYAALVRAQALGYTEEHPNGNGAGAADAVLVTPGRTAPAGG
jgi:ATP-binding cassette subfamily B protein